MCESVMGKKTKGKRSDQKCDVGKKVTKQRGDEGANLCVLLIPNFISYNYCR